MTDFVRRQRRRQQQAEPDNELGFFFFFFTVAGSMTYVLFNRAGSWLAI
jgi:hypothetical protein